MKNRVVIFAVILSLIALISGFFYLSEKEEVPDKSIKITEESSYLVSINDFKYEAVSGIRVNGKGEEIEVNGQGISLRDFMASLDINDYSTVTVIASDAYSASVTKQEIETKRVYFIIEEDLRLIVFDDTSSKRSVSNIEEIIIE